ncbi:MAG: recombinase family protein [Anaerovoracaceae bacterium]
MIIRELEVKNIKRPQGRDRWSKHSIQTILRNEKYIGNVELGKTYTGVFPNNKQRINRGEQEQYLMEDAHKPIIKLEKFEQVQEYLKLRSNVEIVDGIVKRKDTHYSTKKEKRLIISKTQLRM